MDFNKEFLGFEQRSQRKPEQFSEHCYGTQEMLQPCSSHPPTRCAPHTSLWSPAGTGMDSFLIIPLYVFHCSHETARLWFQDLNSKKQGSLGYVSKRRNMTVWRAAYSPHKVTGSMWMSSHWPWLVKKGKGMWVVHWCLFVCFSNWSEAVVSCSCWTSSSADWRTRGTEFSSSHRWFACWI